MEITTGSAIVVAVTTIIVAVAIIINEVLYKIIATDTNINL